ncbi:MAG: ABC transporter permease [Pseudomonadota bacterium]
MSLARITIGYEWRRYLAAILVIALTGVLFYLQAGMLSARWQSLSAFERELDADIIVRATGGILGVQPLRSVSAENFYIHSNVAVAEAFFKTVIMDRNPPPGDPREQDLRAVVVNTAPASMTFPRTLDPRAKSLLAVPGTALVSASLAAETGYTLGSSFSFKGSSLQVVGLFSASFEDRANVIISRRTVQTFYPQNPRGRRAPLAVLLRVEDPERIDSTIAELSQWLERRSAEAVRPEQYVLDASKLLLRADTILQTALLVAVFIVVVAIIITAQTLRSAITALRSQFGTLRALGVGQWRIAAVTMELALWVGLLSAVLAAAISFAVQAVFSYLGLAMLISWTAVGWISTCLLSVAVIAGALCLRFAFTVKPVELLR